MAKKRSLVPWMFLRLIAAALMALTLGAAMLYTFARNQQLELSYGANRDLLQQASHVVDSLLTGVGQKALVLAQNGDLAQLLGFEENVAQAHLSVRNQFEALRTVSREIDSIYLLRYDNRRLLVSGSLWGTGYFLADEFGDPVVGRQRARSGWQKPRLVHNPYGPSAARYISYFLELPIDSSVKEGVLMINLREEALQSLIAKATGPMAGAIQIISLEGTPILGTLDAPGIQALNQALGTQPQQGRVAVEEAEPYYLFYVDSGVVDWVYYMTVSTQVLLAPARILLLWTLLALALAIVLAALLLYVTSIRVIRPIRNLLKRLDNAEPGEGSTEFAELAAIEASWQALSEQNRQYAGEVSDQWAMRRSNGMIALLLGQPCDQEMVRQVREDLEGAQWFWVCLLDMERPEEQALAQAVEALQRQVACLFLPLGSGNAALILGTRLADPEACEMMERILGEWSAGIPATLGMSAPRQDIEALHDSYEEAVAMLGIALQSGRRLFAQQQYKQASASRSLRAFSRLARNLNSRLAEGDIQAAYHLLSQYREQLDHDTTLPPMERRMLTLQLANTLWLSLGDSMPEIQAATAYDMLCVGSEKELEQWMIAQLKRFQEQLAKAQQGASPMGRRMVDFVQRGYTQTLSIDDMASRFRMSSTTFCTVFKEETGQTFMDYLTKLRLEEACRLLRETDRKAGDIAMQSGFGSQQNMQRAFRNQLGTTPTRYRAAHDKRSR